MQRINYTSATFVVNKYSQSVNNLLVLL